ncbi:MAG: sugar phosphate isomerase/epimerase family protein [Candidatus Thorarchaeota archaeon]
MISGRFPVVIMRLPARRAYHVIYDSSLTDALQYAQSTEWNGLAVDFGVPSMSPHLLFDDKREELRRLSKEFSIEWNFHAPGDDVSLFASYPPIRKGIITYFKEIIDLSRDLSFSKTSIVVHTGKPPSFRRAREKNDAYLSGFQDFYSTVLSENLKVLMAYGRPDTHIAVENHEWSPLVRDVIASLLPEGLRLCLDVPKLMGHDSHPEEEDFAIFTSNLDAIDVVHVHDFVPGLGGHQVVGEGVIDFDTVLSLLSRISCRPLYVFEVRPRDLARESLLRFGTLLERNDISL